MIGYIIAFWFVCGFIAYGFIFAYAQRNWPTSAKNDYWADVLESVFIGMFGPISILAVILFSEYKHGWKLW